VETAEPNIHAGTKMLRVIADTYFNDQALDALNKTLFTFASYNVGPNRIASLRNKARSEGLNPGEWFGNVEFVVAKEIGQETVRYVSNIYKYYYMWHTNWNWSSWNCARKRGATLREIVPLKYAV
jgi:membrane-bound lytic murein transglycosylase MltF